MRPCAALRLRPIRATLFAPDGSKRAHGACVYGRSSLPSVVTSSRPKHMRCLRLAIAILPAPHRARWARRGAGDTGCAFSPSQSPAPMTGSRDNFALNRRARARLFFGRGLRPTQKTTSFSMPPAPYFTRSARPSGPDFSIPTCGGMLC